MSYALVTGASKGIGKEIAICLAKRQYNLVLVARSEALLANLAEELTNNYKVKVEFFAADLAKAEAPKQLFDWTKEKNLDISILVNNAGYGLVGKFEDYSIQETNDMMFLNMNTLVAMCYFFLPTLKQKEQSYILNIASSTAYQAIPMMSVYAASKVFVLNFSRGLRQELKDTSVSLTVVSPGATDTNFNDRSNLGEKARKAAEKVTMSPKMVAELSVKGMFAKKAEVITGFLNQLGAFLAWLAPKSITENIAAKLYEKNEHK